MEEIKKYREMEEIKINRRDIERLKRYRDTMIEYRDGWKREREWGKKKRK